MMGTLSVFFFLLYCFCIGCSASIEQSHLRPWEDTKADPKQRARALVAKMTLDEKLAMVAGVKGDYVGNTPKNDRLGIPELHLEDGPQGVGDGLYDVTCFPSVLTSTASWNPSLMKRFAKKIAEEQRGKGTNVHLGPMVNIARVPFGGRNFESMGEDPHLSSVMTEHYILGIQSVDAMMASVKHYVDNNQEYHRQTVSVNVDERTQFELYYPAFAKAVGLKVGSVMCSYNKIGSVWACENPKTLGDLKTTMGYDGYVVSDWGATHSTSRAAMSGLDMEMPSDKYFGELLKAAIKSGTVPLKRLNDMNIRILTSMFRHGLFDHEPTGNVHANVRSEEALEISRQVAHEAAVLLKNKDSIIPMKKNQYKKIAVIGDAGGKEPLFHGGGSGAVKTPFGLAVSPIKGIRNKLNDTDVTVAYASSLPQKDAVKLAAASDVVIMVVGTDSSEGTDRATLSLDKSENELVYAVAKANKNIIVVVYTPGALLMPWLEEVKAVVCGWLPGEVEGEALADILYGDQQATGRLPLSFPRSDNETWLLNSTRRYPGIDDQVYYEEKLNVGYRYYNNMNVSPLFPFGYGLGYSTVKYSGLKISKQGNVVMIDYDMTNVGTVYDTVEVPQLYIVYPSSAGEPGPVLRSFTKLNIPKGQKVHDVMKLDLDTDFNIYQNGWVKVSGEFEIIIGLNSMDKQLTGSFTV